jgi:hypothetical protein
VIVLLGSTVGDAFPAHCSSRRGLDAITDFSVVIKNRASLPKPWRWEIYRAGRNSPIECSSVLYESMTAARRAGNEALKQLLTDFPA